MSEVASEILHGIKDELGDTWGSFDEEDRALFQRVATRAANLQVLAVRGDTEMVRRERRHVDAQLANLRSIAEDEASEIVWRVAADVGKVLLEAAFGVVL